MLYQRAGLVWLLCTAVAAHSAARLKRRLPAFEPTDLDLEPPGTLEFDLQVGRIWRDGEPRTRLFIPDFELDLGLASRVEIDVDGALSLDAQSQRLQLSGDNLWTGVKLGLGALRGSDGRDHAWSAGVQLGPRLPTAPGAQGVGFGLVLLGAHAAPPWHSIANLGALIEPSQRDTPGRTSGALGGIEASLDLDPKGRFAMLSELGAFYSLGPDPHDMHVTLGLNASVSSALDLSLVGFAGFLPNGDRVGVFLGVTPKFDLW
ncbi:MAG TPA: hypothetical protein VHM70_01475 [Polyangiaceae bacterium]|nr:hypothetical protein [Polyangiaceae bacterium]